MDRTSLALGLAAALILSTGAGMLACGSSPQDGFTGTTTGDGGGGGQGTGGFGSGGDAATAPDCSATSVNLAGCPCTSAGATQACYAGPPGTRGVGTCTDGTQTCTKSGEFTAWGDCAGSAVPAAEACTGTTDTNCNGKVGCADPACATDPACNSGCTDGQTRPCYDGPSGTENLGTCKDGTQTCAGGKWPSSCPGEVLPTAENCADPKDHNCNGLPGCLDFFSCLTAAVCQTTCSASNVDPGCVCPQGTGDTATCPEGDHGVHKGGIPGTDECCPCTKNDCGDPGCCGETACKGNSACAGLNCKPLPASCKGQVNSDCDDFPEDCDEPCCKCTNCP